VPTRDPSQLDARGDQRLAGGGSLSAMEVDSQLSFCVPVVSRIKGDRQLKSPNLFLCPLLLLPSLQSADH